MGAGREFVAAQLVQQGFHFMRQLGHVVEAEGGRAAFDRMGTAEDRVELFVVRRFESSPSSCCSMRSRFSPASSKKTW